MSEKGKKQEPGTLTDDDIVSAKSPEVGRRSMVGMIGAGAAVGALALATGCRRGYVRVQTVSTGYTDSDGGACADPGGQGRGNTGITDADGHPCYDPVGRGRGQGARGVVVVQPPQPRVIVQPARTGITDSDPHDPVGNGRGGVRVHVQGGTGITDSDGGPCADPGGGGRGHSGLTDSDSGGCADPAGRGRRGN